MSLFWLLAEDSWILRLLANHVGYISFAIPVATLFLISKKSAYTRWPRPIRCFITALIRYFILDTSSLSQPSAIEKEESPATVPLLASNYTSLRAFKLIVVSLGLQISFLLWGLLQERIMTRTYGTERFTNSQFLVFVNRFLAMIIAYILLRVFCSKKKSYSNRPALYSYGIISYANCMSTWFQYESLLYISFPVQVITKSMKTIPVMIVGKCVAGKTYPPRQYLLMLLMAAGLALFLIGYNESGTVKASVKKIDKNLEGITTLSGIFLLVCYLGFDAFTSNYQKTIFDRYPISFLDMMFFVNLFSTILTFTSLAVNGSLLECVLFMQRHESFAAHVVATSICSSVGQLFIFATIEEFGPVVFTIIMTMRQAFSILLSCIFYEHHLNPLAISGITVAFAAVFLHAFSQFRRSKQSNSTVA